MVIHAIEINGESFLFFFEAYFKQHFILILKLHSLVVAQIFTLGYLVTFQNIGTFKTRVVHVCFCNRTFRHSL